MAFENQGTCPSGNKEAKKVLLVVPARQLGWANTEMVPLALTWKREYWSNADILPCQFHDQSPNDF